MRNRKITVGCVSGIIFIILLAIGVWWVLYSTSDPFKLNNKNSAFEVTTVFSLSLMENRTEILKSLVNSEQWNRINSWEESHNAVTACSIPRFDLENRPWFAVGSTSLDGKSREETLTLSLPCPDRDTYYCLKIKEIALQKTDEGWQIYDWGEIRETWNPYPCN